MTRRSRGEAECIKQDNILEVSGLKTHFRLGKNIVTAVNDLSFALARGDTLGIVGESGCGKSVTAHSIVQLLPKAGYIAGGTIRYTPRDGDTLELSSFDRRSREIRAIRGKEIAMIFQDPQASLNPVFTIGKLITENLLEHESIGKGEAMDRAVKLLAELGIPDPEKRCKDYPHQFSGGMKQRVMIACAMICNPNILIADEPTTALDVTIQYQILTLMKKLQEKHGTSIILITHNMGIVAETCNRIAVMYMGRVVESGSLEQVFSRPLHPYTKALLQSVPVLGIGKKARLASIPGSTPDAMDMPPGCAFAPRCDCARPECAKYMPGDTYGPDGHRVQCFCCGDTRTGGATEDAGDYAHK